MLYIYQYGDRDGLSDDEPWGTIYLGYLSCQKLQSNFYSRLLDLNIICFPLIQEKNQTQILCFLENLAENVLCLVG